MISRHIQTIMLCYTVLYYIDRACRATPSTSARRSRRRSAPGPSKAGATARCREPNGILNQTNAI